MRTKVKWPTVIYRPDPKDEGLAIWNDPRIIRKPETKSPYTR